MNNQTTITRPQTEELVLPVVMLVEGVHNGSAGPVLHLARHFGQSVSDWNGVPVTAGHPVNNKGIPISVHQTDKSRWVIGHVQNARIEDGKLKAEVVINQQRAIAVNPEVLNFINEGKKLEVSTGIITRDISQSGQFNGEEYQAITVEYWPDHLALLPGERGACSWADGCGIRVNKNNNSNHKKMKMQTFKSGEIETELLLPAGFSVQVNGEIETQNERLKRIAENREQQKTAVDSDDMLLPAGVKLEG